MLYRDSITWSSMPNSRPADSYISYADGSVFMDFGHEYDIVRLVRISFDGYGCCDLDRDTIIPMNSQDSSEFLSMYSAWTLDQSKMRDILRRTIEDNKSSIWNDALREYHLLLSNT